MIETVSAFAGFILSLALSFVPGLKDWYDNLPSIQKALIFAALCLAGAIGMAIYEAAHGGDWVAILLSFAQAFIPAWVVGTVTNIPVSKAIKDKQMQDALCTCSQE